MALLNEFVQRQPLWQRPEYNVQSAKKMKKDSSKFGCHVRLRKQDKKQGLLTVDYRPEMEAETVADAKHMAATYVLHRLRNNTNTHKLLPPSCRDYWLSLALDSAADDWRIGEVDPFGAKLRRDKERREREERRDRLARAHREGKVEDLLSDRMRKRWMQLPRVEMSQQCRDKAEEVVKTWTKNWQMSAGQAESNDNTRDKLVKMGFRQQHVAEALETASNGADDAMQWLSIHVPEDDLPQQILDRRYQSTLVVGSNRDCSGEFAVRQLMKMGFSRQLCHKTLGAAEGDMAKAAVRLVCQLCQLPIPQYGGRSKTEEEVEALKAIYGDDSVKQLSEEHIRIKVGDVWLEVWTPVSMDYPDGPEVPAIGVTSETVPAYLRLHITRQLNLKLGREGGMPVVFDAVCLLEENMEVWMQNTPRLSELMIGGTMPEEGTAVRNEEAKMKTKMKMKMKQAVDKQQWIGEAQRMLASLQKSKGYQKMKQRRDMLPAAKLSQKITSLLGTQQVVVVAGATGSGKSTQVPQFILDASISNSRYARILCSQPRRISAIGVANRVMEERTTEELVGYAVRGETRNNTAQTGLLFVTVGVLLRMVREDPLLKDITHVVVDEVHERSVDCDLLLGLLRQTLKSRSDLKVVLMSATAECHELVEYLGGSVVEIEGRTYPVKDVFLDDLLEEQKEARQVVLGKGWHQKNEDWRTALSEWETKQAPHVASQMLQTVRYVLDSIGGDLGESVLVFVPGVSEIDQLVRMLSDKYHVLPLHSSLPTSQQRLVFQRAAGRRKVVVSTDIAETSITIDDIVYVIDLGRVRELRTGQLAFTRVSKLTTVWCSRAAGQQRRGRAGRTRPGVCYRLYTRQQHHQEMAAHAVPEIRRTPVEQTNVAVKSMGYRMPMELLGTLRDPPSAESVEQAEQLLVVLGLVDTVNGRLTGMGELVAQLPMDLRLAKILVVAAVLGIASGNGRVLELVAMMGLDKPLVKDTRGWIEDLKTWEQVRKGKVSRKAVSYVGSQEMHRSVKRLGECLERLGLLENNSTQSVDDTVLRALVWAGMNPNLARVWRPPHKYKQLAGGTVREEGSGAMTFHAVDLVNGEATWMDHSEDHRVYLPRGHQEAAGEEEEEEEAFGFVCFSGLWTSGDGRARMLDVCVPNTYGLLMFGPPLQVDPKYRTASMGKTGRAAWQCWPRIAYLCQQLRRLLDELVRRRMDNPQSSVAIREHPVVRLVLDLISTNGQKTN